MDCPPIASAADRPARRSLRLFGAFELTNARGEKIGSLGKRERALLSYLAVSPHGREQRKKLATLLWCESDSDAAQDSLRTCLWRLRKALGDSEQRLVASNGEDIVINLSAFEVDATVFRLLAAQSARNELQLAADLYSGDFLDGLIIDSEEFEAWRRTEATRYRDQAIEVLTRLMMQLGEAGETRNAIETGNRILRLEPLHDGVVRRLMQLYGESGRRGAAVQLYRTHSETLRSELNARPEPETRDTFVEIAQGGLRPAAGDARGHIVPSPWPQQNGEPNDPLSSDSGSRKKAPGVRWGLAGCLLGAVALLLLQQFTTSTESSTPVTPIETVEAIRPSAANTISFAVLPFSNASGDPAQDVLADGMSEEIVAALAQVPSLLIIGRSSVRRFADQDWDVRAIGDALKVRYVLDGSVRRTGDRVQVTTKLARANDGHVLWVESYDRPIAEIYATQATIVSAITAALGIEIRPNERGDVSRSVDGSTYEYYLRARALLRGRQAASGLPQALDLMKLLEEVVDRNPRFAPGWASLASVYDRIPLYSTAALNGSTDELRLLTQQYAAKAEHAAQRAISLDPNLAEAYLSSAFIDVSRRNMSQAFRHISKALSLDPTNPEVLAGYRNILLEVGRLEEALVAQEKVVALEPFVPRFRSNLATNLWLAGKDDDAIEILRGSREANDVPGQIRLAMIYAAQDRLDEAADTVAGVPFGALPKAAVEQAARLLRGQATPILAGSASQLGMLGFVYLYAGDPSRVVDFYEASLESGYVGIAPLWHQAYAPVRKTQRFKALVEKARLPEFWRAHGWPSFCRPVGTDDFSCG